MTLTADIKEIEILFRKHQNDFRPQVVSELLQKDNMQWGYLKAPKKDRFKEDKNIITLNLVLQGFSRRRIAAFCGISHEGVSARLRKAISMLKARHPAIDIWTPSLEENNMNVTLKVVDTFSASHQLNGYVGPCSNLHGHTWKVEVEVSGFPNPLTGILVDFKVIKKMLKAVLPDHRHLNDVKGLRIPTAENVAVWVYDQLALEIAEYSHGGETEIQLVGVTIWESPEASTTYTGE